MNYIEYISKDIDILSKLVYIMYKKTISNLEENSKLILKNPLKSKSVQNFKPEILIYKLKVEFILLLNCLSMIDRIKKFPWIESRYNLIGFNSFISINYFEEYFLFNNNLIIDLANLIHDQITSINEINIIKISSNPFFIENYYKRSFISSREYLSYIKHTFRKIKMLNYSENIYQIQSLDSIENILYYAYTILMQILLVNFKTEYTNSLFQNFDSLYLHLLKGVRSNFNDFSYEL
jgi:hypothetical protein